MEWIIGIVVVVAVLAAIFGRVERKPKETLMAAMPSAPPPAAPRRREYASILEDGQYRSLTADEVAEMFAEIRERLKEHRRTAKSMQKFADKYLETGKLDEAAYATLEHAEDDTRRTLANAEALNDKLFFETESARERYYKFVDDICEAESDIEYARSEIEDIRQEIEDGDFVPQKRDPPKKTKKPPKGSKPNFRMRYLSMSGNEAEWEILIVAHDGKSFAGWSFEHDQQLNFNVAGVVWAEDIATQRRVADVEAHLAGLLPKAGGAK